MSPRILIVFHGPEILPTNVQNDFPGIEVMTKPAPPEHPWRGLLEAGWHKRQNELDRSILYEKCIAVCDGRYNPDKVRRMIEVPARSGIVTCEAVRPPNVQHSNLQWATPGLFCADSLDFSRLCEFELGMKEIPSEMKEYPIPCLFYYHIKMMSLSIQSLPR